ncbi:MAG: hypothetical protein P1V51_24900 [Deltaproteobacteria bacterium]|nr:hypothetical protein [Deltaproteobacteria bacterium]
MSGSPLFVKDQRGRTPLFRAAEQGDLEAVKEMIYSLPGTGTWPQRLGLIDTRDVEGLTAADVAEARGHDEIARLLRGEAMRMEMYG